MAAPETGEIYLILGELDLAKPDAILDFVSRYGILDVRRHRFREFAAVPGLEDSLFQLREAWPTTVKEEYERATERDDDMPPGETLGEFRFGARIMRDLTTAWRWVHDDEPPADAQWEFDFWSPHKRATPPDIGGWLTHILNRSLSAFSPSLALIALGLGDYEPRAHALPKDHDFEGDLRTSKDELPPDRRNPWGAQPLYATCCLELFNHIAENAPYHKCQNEPCGRLYVRQTGRVQSVNGQYRLTGVKYCSPGCAKAAAMRALRARRRREVLDEKGGSHAEKE